jgi:hypothetical protein
MRRVVSILAVFTLLVALFAGCAKDQNTVSGTITYTDALSGEQKVGNGATVYLMLDDSTYLDKTTADANGNYVFYPVEDGNYFIFATLSTVLFDYSGKSATFTVKGKDEVEINVNMTNKSNTIEGQAVIVINGDEYVSSDVEVSLYVAGSETPIQTVNCDQDGYYRFTKLKDGDYDVDAYYVDENNKEYYDLVENIRVMGGEVKTVNLTLTELKK